METLWQDLRYSARQLRRAPGFTALVVVTFALGIGGNTAIFSLIHAVLLKPLPYPDFSRLVMVLESEAQNSDNAYIVSAPNYLDWEKQNTVFERMGVYEYLGFNLSGGKEPEQVGGLRASSSLFEVLGARPLLGRRFLPDEEVLGKDRVVLLSHRLWSRRYDSDPNIVGKAIRLNQTPYTVVGVMRPGFAFPSPRQVLWVPIGFSEEDQGRGSHSFFVVARLKPEVTVEQARAEMDVIGRRLAQQYPESNTGESATVVPMSRLWTTDIERTLLMLLAAVGSVLLIACVNIANLLLVRATARQRELAVRTALGASPLRLVRQLLTESLLLAFLGAALGIVLAAWTTQLLIHMFPPGLRDISFRDLSVIELDMWVLVFTLGLAVFAGVACGLAPALHNFRFSPGEFLKEGGTRATASRTAGRFRNGLVTAEVGLAFVVLVGAGLMISSLAHVLRAEPGLNPDNVLVLDLSLPQADFYGPPTRPRFCQDIRTTIGGVTGVASVSAVSHVPLTGSIAGRSFTIEGRPAPAPGETPGAHYGLVCPGFFATLQIPLLRGRDFADHDTTDAPQVVIINESFQKRFFPQEDAAGRRIKFGQFDSAAPWMTIVGVARDVRHYGLASGFQPYFYRPYSQGVWPSMSVVVRTETAPDVLVEPIRRALAKVMPEQPVGGTETMAEVAGESTAFLRFPMFLFAVFALLALVLAAVGIYGVVSYTVSQRTHEIGIRKALGAQPGDVYRLVLRQAMRPIAVGVGLGLAGAVAVTRFLQSLLFGVSSTDPIAFSGVALLLTAVGLAACWLPARRATRVDPMVARRYE